MNEEQIKYLWNSGINTLHELETDEGILASGRNEKFGAIFGRDSLIVALKLINAHEKKGGDAYFLSVAKKILLNLQNLQGKEINIESGEEPGKFIHEFRPDKHDFLTKEPERPWYSYPDGTMKNYDSVDSTALFLIATINYFKASGDHVFLKQILGSADLALDWLLIYGDKNGDGFIDYEFPVKRVYGGLVTQSWMDSAESVFHEDGEKVEYPIAPVEVQAYAYRALRLWAEHLKDSYPAKSKRLSKRANKLKKLFNKKFAIKDESGTWTLAYALDGNGKPLVSARSSIGHCLWAGDQNGDCVLNKLSVPKLVRRLMSPDLFEPNAGIRTLSTLSVGYGAMSYHNGSIWPHDTSMIIEGLENFGYKKEAGKIKDTLLKSLVQFETPVELYAYDGKLMEYYTPEFAACRKQAWSAAAMVSELAPLMAKMA